MGCGIAQLCNWVNVSDVCQTCWCLNSGLARRMSFDRRRVVCRFFTEGKCSGYEHCFLPHYEDIHRSPDTLCRNYFRGKCGRGKRCSYDHISFSEVVNSALQELNLPCLASEWESTKDQNCCFLDLKMVIGECIDLGKVFCRDFAGSGCCPAGSNCPLPHVKGGNRKPDNLCRSVFLSRCPYGNNCKHIHMPFAVLFNPALARYNSSKYRSDQIQRRNGSTYY